MAHFLPSKIYHIKKTPTRPLPSFYSASFNVPIHLHASRSCRDLAASEKLVEILPEIDPLTNKLLAKLHLLTPHVGLSAHNDIFEAFIGRYYMALVPKEIV